MMGKSHDEFMIEHFRSDPAYAAKLINSILEDGDDQGELKIILGLAAAAFGASSNEPQTAADINRLAETFRAIGLQLSVAPAPTSRKRSAQSVASKRTGRVRRPAAKPAKVHA